MFNNNTAVLPHSIYKYVSSEKCQVQSPCTYKLIIISLNHKVSFYGGIKAIYD